MPLLQQPWELRTSAGVDIRGEGCLLLGRTPVTESGGATARAVEVLESLSDYLSVLSMVFSKPLLAFMVVIWALCMLGFVLLSLFV